jgi:hypothetical protein
MDIPRLVALFCCLALVVPTAAGTVAGGGPVAASNPCVGTMEQPPDGSTLVTIQGIHFTGEEVLKTPGLLVSFGPRGGLEWAHNASAHGRWWAYDVDPLENGNLLFATTEPGVTVVEEIDPYENEHVWVEKFNEDNGANPGYHPENVTDAHDVDLINGDELLIADKGDLHHRLLIYNLTQEKVTWKWNFSDYPEAFPQDGGGPYRKDWTHVNDVDKIGPGKYMASVRNFDSVIVVDRETKEIDLRLGADDEERFMNEQHNPQYLEDEQGNPTILIADSLNDRVVEWEQRDGEWVKTWELVGGGLDEPRDADRLPNGNTLVVDRKGHRTVEVTPAGKVVWEVYTPWQPYDAEREVVGEEPGGPTTSDMGSEGTVELHNSAAFTDDEIDACGRALTAFAPSRLDTVLGRADGKKRPEDGPATVTVTDPGENRGIPLRKVGLGVGLLVVLLGVAAVIYRRR